VDTLTRVESAALLWRELPFDARAAVLPRAEELLAYDCRCISNAATMLGQATAVHQAGIDAPCELIKFSRFNVAHAEDLFAQERNSAVGTWNRLGHRPLEGFVLAGLLTPQPQADRTP
jgi:1-pyrroline-5-carboxylate dehydrogenase